ncbi:MAG: 4-hydroxythreonine-4-phosphate dehydrogenase [Bacteroidia bacterium]|nr:MAG: 4-hydroxythreonine-4-phosphate dehydrogenase [Bacteroidia bacterium]
MEKGSLDKLPRVAFTIGEPGGIGPQLLFHFLQGEGWAESFIPIVLAHRRVIERWRSFLGLSGGLRYHAIRHVRDAKPAQLNLIECGSLNDFVIGSASPEGGRLARTAFIEGVKLAQTGELDLLVTLPVDKATFYDEATFPYRGHTEYLRAHSPNTPPLMLMVSDTLRIAVLTEHIPLREVAHHITAQNLRQAILTLHQTLKQDFGVPTPRIAILGLNPHAGDDGIIGAEEKEVIQPLIAALGEESLWVGGPFSPDGFFAARGYQRVDAVLALYHDQGLIPFKLLVGWEGFQYSSGLPFVRTAPDHGVAYDQVGKDTADISSLSLAVWEGLAIVRRRQAWQESQGESGAPS